MDFLKKRDCTIRVAKTKALISFAVTAKLICVFVFAYAKSWFSHNEAHIMLVLYNTSYNYYKSKGLDVPASLLHRCNKTEYGVPGKFLGFEHFSRFDITGCEG